MPECPGTLCSKQVRYLKFKCLQRDSNLQPLSLETNTQPFSQTGLSVLLRNKWLWVRVPLQSLLVWLTITTYQQMTPIVCCRKKFLCGSVRVCAYEYVCYVHAYICVQYYKDLKWNSINWYFKQRIINDLCLNNHQQNKSKKYSQSWTVEPDQYSWGARAKMTVLKSSK